MKDDPTEIQTRHSNSFGCNCTSIDPGFCSCGGSCECHGPKHYKEIAREIRMRGTFEEYIKELKFDIAMYGYGEQCLSCYSNDNKIQANINTTLPFLHWRVKRKMKSLARLHYLLYGDKNG